MKLVIHFNDKFRENKLLGVVKKKKKGIVELNLRSCQAK